MEDKEEERLCPGCLKERPGCPAAETCHRFRAAVERAADERRVP